MPPTAGSYLFTTDFIDSLFAIGEQKLLCESSGGQEQVKQPQGLPQLAHTCSILPPSATLGIDYSTASTVNCFWLVIGQKPHHSDSVEPIRNYLVSRGKTRLVL